MADPKAIPSSEHGQPGKPGASVIRLLHGAEETDRLTKKHLPAWVVSGGVHVVLILVLYGFSVMFSKAAQANNIDVVNTTVEKEDEPPVKDLTNDDVGLDSNLPAAVDVEREAEKTVDAVVTKDEIGINLDKNDNNATLPPGIVDNGLTTPGAAGEFGNIMTGGGNTGGTISAGFLGRSGATRAKLVQEGGGNSGSELAVARGLKWLANQQKPDGGWQFDGSAKEDRIAATGLSLLPFLAAGETHMAGKTYKEVVRKGIMFLLNNLNASDGRFNSKVGNYMYGHGIASIALCEAYGMSKDRALLLRPCQAVIGLIQRVQHTEGGWRYPAQPVPGDTSVVGWQVQALQAARLSKDIPVDDKVVQGANKFLDKVSGGSRKATYGYTDGPGAAGTAMTAVGLLCRYYFSGWSPANGGMAEGVEGLLKNGPKPGGPLAARGADIYYYYYATQVVHFYGGKEWRDWNEGPLVDGKRTGGMRDWLVKLQVDKGNNLGSWDPDGGSIGGSGGRLGTTCLCILTLEVYYRHLPLFKREGAGGGEALK